MNVFNRESGQLWQVGHFLHGEKHGSWIRYVRNGAREYEAEFEHGKQLKKV